MGAKVECESYMPGYYVTGDLNIEANGRWSAYYERTSNDQLCNDFPTKPMNGYSDYDKEMLKHKMLEHEAVFRQQVYELHRVYKIQRDIMNQHQSKSWTNSPSQMAPNVAKMAWQMQVPSVSTTYRKALVADHSDTNQSSVKFLRESSVQSSPNGFLSNDAAPSRRQGTLDLHLPADHYIDDDNSAENKTINFLGLASDTEPQNDIDLTLVSAEGLGRFNGSSSTLGLQTTNNLGIWQVDDINESNTGIYTGRANGSLSRGVSHTLENSWHQSMLRSSTTTLSFNKGYSKDKHTNEGTSSTFIYPSVQIRQEDKLLINEGKQASIMNFLAPRHNEADRQKFLEAANGSHANHNQFVYHGQNCSFGWFAQSPLEPSAVNSFAKLDCKDHSSIDTVAAPISTRQIDHPSIVSPMGSCTADPRSTVINNPAFIPRFNGSSAGNSHTSLSTVTQSIGTSALKLKNVDSLDGHYTGFPDPFSGSHSRHQATISSDLKQKNALKFDQPAQRTHEGMKSFNLNETLSDGQEDGLVEQDVRCVGSLQNSKNGGSIFGTSWLKNKAKYADSTASKHPGMLFGHPFETAVDPKKTKHENQVALTIPNLSDSASTSQDCGIKKGGASEDIALRTLLTCNETLESVTCLPVSCQKPVPKSAQAPEGTRKESDAGIKNFIDLNADVPNGDNSEESVVSHECHVAPLPNNQSKRTFVIDLEVPAFAEDSTWLFDQECVHPGKLDAYQKADNTSAASAVAAAENIVVLSMDTPTITEASDDMLQWFADLAISNIDEHAEQVGLQACNSCSDDELDSFESLVLKLEETKIDEYWSRPLEPAITTDEQTVAASNLLTKPRRGQQRRRRQKRDFQKDILPGLSTLSRPEIIEDIQLLEVLVLASGGSWESSLTRRGHYGGRARGRKPRKNVVTVTIEEDVEVSPSPSKPASAGDLADDGGMIGWGKTTRRCRRTRCPSGSNVATTS